MRPIDTIIFLLCAILAGCANNSLKANPSDILWSHNTKTQAHFEPEIIDSTLYVASDKDIYKIDPSDGTVISKFAVAQMSSGLSVGSGQIYVTTAKAELLALSKTDGSIVWKVSLPTISFEKPIVTNSNVIVKCSDTTVLAYSFNGNLLWSYQNNHNLLTVRSYHTMLNIDNQALAVGMSSAKLVLLNIANGSVIWENRIAVLSGTSEIDKLSDIVIRPVIHDNTIYIANYNGKIAALDVISGNKIWDKEIGNVNGLTFNEFLYGIQDSTVFAINKSGNLIWNNKSVTGRHFSDIKYLNDTILVKDNDGYIFIFDKNGKEINRIKTIDGINLFVMTNGIFLQSSSKIEMIKV